MASAALDQPPAASAPPPVASGPGIVVGPGGRPAEVQDEEILRMMLADWQFGRIVDRALARTEAASEAFARLGSPGGCAALLRASEAARAGEAAAWRAAFVRAARASVPDQAMRAIRAGGIAEGDALLNAYRPALQRAMTPEGEPIALRAIAAAERALAREAAAAPVPGDALRAVRLEELGRLRSAARGPCARP